MASPDRCRRCVLDVGLEEENRRRFLEAGLDLSDLVGELVLLVVFALEGLLMMIILLTLFASSAFFLTLERVIFVLSFTVDESKLLEMATEELDSPPVCSDVSISFNDLVGVLSVQ